MSIQNALGSAVYSQLSSGTALTTLLTSGTAGIYFKNVPKNNQDADFVIFDFPSDLDLNLSPGREKNELILVKGVSKNNPAKAGTIDANIDALLHDQTLSVSGWVNIWTRRESGVSFHEDDAGDRFYHSGAYFRIFLMKE